MKAADIAILKELSQDVVNILPSKLTTNGKGELFCDGKPAQTIVVISQLEIAQEKINELNFIIQKLESRKSSN